MSIPEFIYLVSTLNFYDNDYFNVLEIFKNEDVLVRGAGLIIPDFGLLYDKYYKLKEFP